MTRRGIPLPAVNPQEARRDSRPLPPLSDWLNTVTPTFHWDWPYLALIIQNLNKITAGELRRLMLFIPPRHGKSSLATVRYPVYRLEADPGLRVIIGAYNQELALTFGRSTRRLASTRFPLSADRRAAHDWETDAGGGVRSVGVGQGITGRGGNLIIIDDPIKSRAEAESLAYRDAVWDWYTNDLYTRLEPGGAIILIMTRWSYDDLAGRILNSSDAVNWSVIKLPAEAEENDPLGRPPGAALSPARFNEEALHGIKKVLGLDYYALYQQTPMARAGAFFDRSWFTILPAAPATARRVRYWDKAASAAGDYTVGLLMAEAGGVFFIEDVIRGQWSTFDRENVIKTTAIADAMKYGQLNVLIWLEEEPGSGGVDSANLTIQNLAGFPIQAEKATGAKTLRAEPFANQAQAGNVKLIAGVWNEDYLLELSTFPKGAHDDQVDGSSGAFSKLSFGLGPSAEEWLEAYQKDRPGGPGDDLLRPGNWGSPARMG